MEWNLSHTMMPGIVSMVTMLLAVALTADQLVTEKEEGLLTRDYVCGVGVPVYLAAQITVRYCFTLPSIDRFEKRQGIGCVNYRPRPEGDFTLYLIQCLSQIL